MMQALGLVWESLIHSHHNVREVRVPLAVPAHFGAKLLLEHWWQCQAQGGIVMGKDIPSQAVRSVLRNVAVYEPVEEGADFRARLAGTAFLRRFARDVSGLRLSDFVAKEQLADLRATIASAIAIGAPLVHDVRIVVGDKAYLEYETLHLKVWAPNRKAAWALGSIFYKDWT